jgi:hypothetical protein
MEKVLISGKYAKIRCLAFKAPHESGATDNPELAFHLGTLPKCKLKSPAVKLNPFTTGGRLPHQHFITQKAGREKH